LEGTLVFSAIFSILVGVGMIGQWTLAYVKQQIPELETERIRILFHIAAELITALVLIAGGIGLLCCVEWGVPLYLIAIGMLCYTAIVSPGYFAQQGQWGWLGLFSVLLILALISVFTVL
jgi:hypothetical protein